MSDVHKISREINIHPTIRTVALHSTGELVGQSALTGWTITSVTLKSRKALHQQPSMTDLLLLLKGRSDYV